MSPVSLGGWIDTTSFIFLSDSLDLDHVVCYLFVLAEYQLTYIQMDTV